MRLFTCIDHACVYPVGAASVVVAANEGEAYNLLRHALAEHGLKDKPFTLQEISMDHPSAVILRDGDY